MAFFPLLAICIVTISLTGMLFLPVLRQSQNWKRALAAFIFLLAIRIIYSTHPAVFYQVLAFDTSINDEIITFVLIPGLFNGLALIILFNKSDNSNPQLLSNDLTWTPGSFYRYTVTQLVFIVCLEMIFRGILFFSVADQIGIIAAFVMNGLIYSAFKLTSSLREAIVSFPLSLLLCYVSWKTGNFWYAALIHFSAIITSEVILGLVYSGINIKIPTFRIRNRIL